MSVEHTGTFVDEPCDQCEQKGRANDPVIEFSINSKENPDAALWIHKSCLVELLKGILP